MKHKMIALIFASSIISFYTNAQEGEEEEKKKGFNKENLFTGGSISLAFYNNTFLIGASPVFGYSITNWADLGIVVNYNYTSYRDYNFVFNDKLKQYVYGGGGFVKLYPVRFLFVQAQYEYNFIKQKFIPNVGTTQEYNTEAGSFLVGGGYTTGRYGRGGQPFFILLYYLIFRTTPILPIPMGTEERSQSSGVEYKSLCSRVGARDVDQFSVNNSKGSFRNFIFLSIGS